MLRSSHLIRPEIIFDVNAICSCTLCEQHNAVLRPDGREIWRFRPKLQTKTSDENSKRKLHTKTSEENFSANCLFECAPIVDAREYHRIKSHETEQTPNGFYNHLLQNETRALLQLTGCKLQRKRSEQSFLTEKWQPEKLWQSVRPL